jgi:hypothetical protein
MAAYTKTEISDLAFNRLTDAELDEPITAFNGLHSMFGRAWLDDYFKGMGLVFVRHVMEMWGDLQIVNVLPGAEVIVERWRHGIREQGVIAELKILAQLRRGGFEVELFPEVGRVPDARIRVRPGQPWTYVEASQRGISKTRSDAELTMQQVSDKAANSFLGVHSKIALLRQPGASEFQRIVKWLDSLPPSGSQLEDLAVLYVEPIETAVGANDVLYQHVPEPRFFSTHLAWGVPAKKATVCIRIEDTGAEKMLKEKVKQLPASQAGIMILDTSSIIGGLEMWESLVHRRFQPSINTRIGAVVLTQWCLGDAGHQSESSVLTNPHAAIPIDSDIIERLKSAFPRVTTATPPTAL